MTFEVTGYFPSFNVFPLRAVFLKRMKLAAQGILYSVAAPQRPSASRELCSQRAICKEDAVNNKTLSILKNSLPSLNAPIVHVNL